MAGGPSKPTQLRNLLVSALDANSTVAALFVHPVDQSGAYVSPGAGSTQVSIKEILTSSGASVMDSTNNAIGVTIRAGSAAGTEYTDGDVDASVSGQAIFFDNSSNTLRPVTIARGLPVNVVAGTISVSTETTVRQSTYTDFNTLSRLADRDASTAVAAVSNGVPASTAYGVVVRLPAPFIDSTNNALRVFQAASSGGASSTEVTVRQSTIGDLKAAVYQSTAADLNVTVAGYSTTVNVSSVGGIVKNQIVDRDQSTQVAAVLNATPASTVWALAVREVAPSTGAFAISSIAGRTLVDQNSTVWAAQVSSVAGRVLVDQNSTVWSVQVSSVAGKVLVDQNSTVWNTQARVFTSSGGSVEGSTAAPAANAIGLHMRQVFPTLLSTTIVITSTNSTAIYPLVSSAASPLRHKCYAYFVSSTHTNPSTLIFCSSASGSGFDHWHVGFGSGSSGMTGANMALTPPGFIFAGVANTALNVKVEGGSSAASTVVVRVSISYFTEA